MKKLFNTALCATIFFAASCSKNIDNYDGPTETLKGNITDVATGKPVQLEASGDAVDSKTGARVKLLETSWSSNPTPLYLAVKQDGTFNNTKVFAATYTISVEGPFVPLVRTGSDGKTIDESKTVEVKGGTTTVDFQVQPFLNIEWVGDPAFNAVDSTVTATVKITRGTTDPSYQQAVTDINLFVNNTQYIGNNNYDSRYSDNYKGNLANVIGQTITLKTKGVLPTKRDVYFRVGARINFGLKLYNYNEPKMLTIP